ncbi:unnamed protein product [Brassica rapa]|uniref:Uncharacterized protein n=2 Tax=Brassica TaxID=3705 RepID=A0A3P6DI66_BRACM|nr:unnamed protein product [Brassica napus]CAG7909546.1 unnamed protein product [Brassica rapa]VDD23131.1 unnamed protein product [Brassica rapa]
MDSELNIVVDELSEAAVVRARHSPPPSDMYKIHTEGHIVLMDLEISMEKSLGDSLRRIPRSRYSPINNKRNPSKKHKITSR